MYVCIYIRIHTYISKHTETKYIFTRTHTYIHCRHIARTSKPKGLDKSLVKTKSRSKAAEAYFDPDLSAADSRYVCMYACMYAWLYIHACIIENTIQKNTYVCRYVYVCVCVCVDMHTCVQSQVLKQWQQSSMKI